MAKRPTKEELDDAARSAEGILKGLGVDPSARPHVFSDAVGRASEKKRRAKGWKIAARYLDILAERLAADWRGK